ncbi:MAG: glycoside hydrolase family 32 protein [Armatimonadetes bacterium]|nr:glycoside hydrolase family 32 protein [Armatimonadota bacterium]
MNDPHHPIYHYQPGNWMNDPKLFFHNGEYHVFLQHNPKEAAWGNMHWAHAKSTDLVHWTPLPIALAPTPDSPDAKGCWTGCVVENDVKIHILYTGITPEGKQVQCLATSDDLIEWEKHAGNPVVSEKPEGFGDCFRDPCAWREGEEWKMIIGSEVGGVGGAALLYTSPNLTDWTFLHSLFTGRAEETGHDFECPDFFPLGGRHVLLTSRGQTFWHVGAYDGERFHRERWGMTDGGSFYAAKTLEDDKGRRILWGWIQERRTEEEQKAAGWSGVLSLPRVLTLLPDGTLGIEPVEELQALRGRHWRFEHLEIPAGEESLLLPEVEGDALEVRVRFAPADAKVYGILARCSPGLEERTEIVYLREDERLGNAPLALGEGEGLDLTVYVDRSVIEAFANGRACHTSRFYPERDDSRRIGLFARGGSVKIETVDVWEMKPI